MYTVKQAMIDTAILEMSDRMRASIEQLDFESEGYNLTAKDIFQIYGTLRVLCMAEDENFNDLYGIITWCQMATGDPEDMGCMAQYYKDSYEKMVIVE